MESLPLLNESKVVMLPKKGEKLDPGNYRPISLRHMLVNILDRWI